ncbi:MAG: hypothetical protein CML03_01030 [Pseudooceanicola sp.]|nr:hypothetical protein [Pseudooceanicola sp.]
MSDEITRYAEKEDQNYAQECLCNRRPISLGLAVDSEGDYVDFEDYDKLRAELEQERIALRNKSWVAEQLEAELEQERGRVKELNAALGIAYHHMLPCSLTEEEILKIDAALSAGEGVSDD